MHIIRVVFWLEVESVLICEMKIFIACLSLSSAVWYLGIFAVLVIVTLRVLRNVSDAYTIKRELYADAACKLIGLVIAAVSVVTRYGPIHRMVFLVVVNIVIFQALTWKILTSYGINILNGTARDRVKWNSASRGSRSAFSRSKLTLCDLFVHPRGIQAFEGTTVFVLLKQTCLCVVLVSKISKIDAISIYEKLREVTRSLSLWTATCKSQSNAHRGSEKTGISLQPAAGGFRLVRKCNSGNTKYLRVALQHEDECEKLTKYVTQNKLREES